MLDQPQFYQWYHDVRPWQSGTALGKVRNSRNDSIQWRSPNRGTM